MLAHVDIVRLLAARVDGAVAVVPIFRNRSWLDLLYAGLPLFFGLLLLAALMFVLHRITRNRSLRFKAAVAAVYTALVLGSVGGVFVIMALQPRPATSPGGTSERWLTFMGNAGRTGNVDGAPGPANGEKVWDFSGGLLPAPFGASPSVANGRVYVGSDNGKLYCLDGETGAVAWEFKAATALFASPVVSAGLVYLGEGLHETNDAKLYCLNAFDGSLVWSFQTKSHIEFSPTLFEGKLYVGAGDDGVWCLDAATGAQVWQFKGVHVDMSPAVTADGVFFGNVYGPPHCYRLALADGSLVWKVPAPYGVCGSPATDGERVYFGLGNGTFGMSHAEPKGAVWCLSVADGAKVWTREAGDAVLTAVALDGEVACYGSRDGKLYCVGAKTGELRWAFDARQPVLSSPAVAAGRVYFGCDDGNVYCIELASSRLIWKYDTSAAAFNPDARVMSSPAIAGGRVYVGSINGHFFCLGNGRRE